MDVFCHRLVPQLLVFTLNQYLCYFAMNSAVGARQEAGTGTLRAVQGLWLFLSAELWQEARNGPVPLPADFIAC